MQIVYNICLVRLQQQDVHPAAGRKIVGWSDDPHYDGDHRNIDVYEDMELVVYLEEIEPDES